MLCRPATSVWEERLNELGGRRHPGSKGASTAKDQLFVVGKLVEWSNCHRSRVSGMSKVERRIKTPVLESKRDKDQFRANLKAMNDMAESLQGKVTKSSFSSPREHESQSRRIPDESRDNSDSYLEPRKPLLARSILYGDSARPC